MQNPHSVLGNLLTGPEGLHYGDVRYMPLQCTLKMQHMPYTYFTSLIQEKNYQLEGTPMDAASHTTTILLVFLSDDQLQTIEYIHIGLVVCHASCQLYEQKAIPWFIKSIEDHLEKARSKREACRSLGRACSSSMFVANFGSLMAVPTEPPYCLVYPNIYAASIPPKDRNQFNVQGGPPRLCTHTSASAMPCSSMQTCLRPTGRNTMVATWWFPGECNTTTCSPNNHAAQSLGTAHRSPIGGTLLNGSSGGLPTGGQDFPRDAQRQSAVQQ